MRLKSERKVNKQTKVALEMETMSLPIELEKVNEREDFLIFDYKASGCEISPPPCCLLACLLACRCGYLSVRGFVS